MSVIETLLREHRREQELREKDAAAEREHNLAFLKSRADAIAQEIATVIEAEIPGLWEELKPLARIETVYNNNPSVDDVPAVAIYVEPSELLGPLMFGMAEMYDEGECRQERTVVVKHWKYWHDPGLVDMGTDQPLRYECIVDDCWQRFSALTNVLVQSAETRKTIEKYRQKHQEELETANAVPDVPPKTELPRWEQVGEDTYTMTVNGVTLCKVVEWGESNVSVAVVVLPSSPASDSSTRLTEP